MKVEILYNDRPNEVFCGDDVKNFKHIPLRNEYEFESAVKNGVQICLIHRENFCYPAMIVSFEDLLKVAIKKRE